METQPGASSADIGSSGVPSPPAKVATVTCSICGCESPLTEYFRKIRKGMLCPRCLLQEWSRNELNIYISLFALGALAAMVAGKLFGYPQWVLLLNLLLFFALLWPIVCVHEAIHGLTAWLSGGQVHEIALGGGKFLRSFRCRGTRFAWRQRDGMYMGFCAAAFSQRQHLRMRWLLYVMAPLTAQVLLIVWLLPSFEWQHFGTELAVVETLVVLNAGVVALNLWPRNYSGMRATDGFWIWQLLRGTKKLDELHASYYVLASHYAYEYEDFPAMQAAAEVGFALYPGNLSLKNNLAAAYLAQDRYA